MCDLINLIENRLSRLVGSAIISFNKCTRQHVFADYMIHCEETTASSVLPEVKAGLSEELASSVLECRYNETRHCASLKLERCAAFKLGITGFLFSSYLENFKVFDYEVRISHDESSLEDLSGLRIKHLHDVLVNCVTELSSIGEGKPRVALHLSTRHRPPGESTTPVTVGPVRSNSLSLNLYMQLRRKEIMDMCCHKLEVNAEVQCVDDLVNMAVTYDMLHTNIHKHLSINVDPTTSLIQPSSKGALFIVYNYVRLTMLLSAFDSRVAAGDYPPLPSLSDLDFTLLKTQEEWSLMFDYILMWPSVLHRTFDGLSKGRAKIHHMLTFLSNLATDFSHYYHRTRILVEGKKQLLPTIYTRIYLLRTLDSIYRHALRLLNINPPSFM